MEQTLTFLNSFWFFYRWPGAAPARALKAHTREAKHSSRWHIHSYTENLVPTKAMRLYIVYNIAKT